MTTTTDNANNTAPEKKKPHKFPLWKNVIAMILVVALFVGGTYFGADLYTRHGEEISVPNLLNLTVDQACERLDMLGLQGEVRDSIYNRSLAPGLVCQQSIGAGNKVKQGRVIYLTVNTNHAETLTLPDLADNSSYREANAKLIAMGFNMTAPQYIDGERDWVYDVKCNGRSVCAGSRIEISDPVTLVVGNGRTMISEEELSDSLIDNLPGYDSDIFEIF